MSYTPVRHEIVHEAPVRLETFVTAGLPEGGTDPAARFQETRQG